MLSSLHVFRAGRNSPPAVSSLWLRARERPGSGVSRSGAMPEPTVIVRMKEDEHAIAAQGQPDAPRWRAP